MRKALHLEIIRFLAICLVVFNHTDGYFIHFATTDNSLTYCISMAVSVICRINVPLFFMVSGALLLRKEEDLSTLYKKRIVRIAAVIIIFSAIQYTANQIAGKLTGEWSVISFLKSLYTADVTESYWFLYSYMAILLMLPFLRKMARGMTEQEFRYLFLLKIIFDVVLRVIATYSGISVGLSLWILTDNVFYVMFGYYMEHILTKRRYEMFHMGKITALFLFFVLLSMGAVVAEYLLKGEYSQSYLGIFTPVLAIMVYYMVKSICMKYTLPEIGYKTAVYLGGSAFGIYLIEKLVRRQLLPLYLYLCEVTVGPLANTVYVLGTIGLALIYVSIMKKVPGIRQLI